MSTHKKRLFSQLVIILGFLAVGLFFLLEPPSVDADQPVESPAVLGNLGDSGNLDAFDANGIIAPLVDPNNNLFLFWKDANSAGVYYSYYDGASWIDKIQVVDHENNPIQASYGMDATMVYPDNTPMVCLFYKSASNASKSEGIATPLCAALSYDENSKPVLSWKQTYAHRLTTSSVRTIVSASESPIHQNSIYLAWDRPNALVSPDEPRIGNLNAYECEVVNGAIVHINCGDSILPDLNLAGDVPGFIAIKDAWSEAVTSFIFYAERYKADYEIYYFNITNGTPISLEDSSETSRHTADRIDAYQSANSDYVYVAYKYLYPNDIYFSKIATAKLVDFDQGQEEWTHCKEVGVSVDGPALINYNNALYVFFSNYEYSGRIHYQRIDNRC